MSKFDSVMSVRGTMSEPRITIGPRETPLSTVPVQLLNVSPERATAPVSGVVWEYQYWSMSFKCQMEPVIREARKLPRP
jgi:hypothetical protein